MTGEGAKPSRYALYRERLRGGPARVPQPCGTYAAYMRHTRKGEPVDAACRTAYNAHMREMYARRKGG